MSFQEAAEQTEQMRRTVSRGTERARFQGFAPRRSTGYSFLGELLYRAHRAVEHPIIFHDRTLGVSKLDLREIYLGTVDLLRLRFSRR